MSARTRKPGQPGPARLLASLVLLAAWAGVWSCAPAERAPLDGTRNDLLARRPDAVFDQPGRFEPEAERGWGRLGVSGWRMEVGRTESGLAWVETTQPVAVLRLPALAPRDRTVRLTAWSPGADAETPVEATLRLNGVGERSVALGPLPELVACELDGAAWRQGENLLELEVPVHPDGRWSAVRVALVEYDDPVALVVDPAAHRVELPPGAALRYLIEARTEAQLEIAGTSRGDGRLVATLAALDPRTSEPIGEETVRAVPVVEIEGGRRLGLPTGSGGLASLELAWRSDEPAPLVLERLEVVEAEERPRPPIVFISVDTLSAAHMSLHGYGRETTPCMDALAEESVVFERCLVNAPWTMPSYLSVMTGIYPRSHELDLARPPGLDLAGWDNWQIAPSRWTLAEALRALGYKTAGWVDTHWLLDRFRIDQGFDLYDASAAEVSIADPTGGIAWIHHHLREWFDGLSPGEPWFLFVHALDAHGPYLPGEGFVEQFATEAPEEGWTEVPAGSAFQTYRAIPEWMARTSMMEGDIPARLPLEPIVQRYDEAIRKTDHYVGRILDELRERGLYEDTIVVVSADHGESFAHDFYSHGGMWEAIVHVPLLIRLPRGEHGGTRVTTNAQLVDLYPTLLELAGIDPRRGYLHGRSLAPLMRGEELPDVPIFAEEGHCEQYMLVEGDWKLVVEHPGKKSAPQSLLTHPRVPESWLEEHAPELVDGALTPAFFKELMAREGFPAKLQALRQSLQGPYVSLYDVSADPGETRDLSRERTDVVQRLMPLLERERERSLEARADARATATPQPFDAEQLEELRALGYVGD